ncbi:hypothetical protein C4573_07050 [Candidatus Woesearchaeota archaeon]|nr:MAG: hypothetical protein C4573_07050 [Candidatus Woesearchaeota archaeon]
MNAYDPIKLREYLAQVLADGDARSCGMYLQTLAQKQDKILFSAFENILQNALLTELEKYVLCATEDIFTLGHTNHYHAVSKHFGISDKSVIDRIHKQALSKIRLYQRTNRTLDALLT